MLLLVVVLIIALVTLPQSNVPDEQAERDAPLELSLELDLAVMAIDGGFVYGSTIKNVTDESIYVGPCKSEWSIRNLDTDDVSPWSGFTNESNEEPRPEHMIKLEPGHSSGSVLGAIVDVELLASEAGRYELQTICRPYVDWEEHEGVRVWNKDDEPLKATFEFTIIE